MRVGSAGLRVPHGDERGEWLRAVVELFLSLPAVPQDGPKAPPKTVDILRLAEVICRHAGRDGVCRVARRDLMEEAGIGDARVFDRCRDELVALGYIHRDNPGAPSRHTAEYALVDHEGTFIRGGPLEDAPRLPPLRFQVVRNGHDRFWP